MVINNSKVRRARIFGRSDTGGRTEFLLVERLPNNRWSAMVSRARKHRTGKHFHFADGVSGTIEGQDGVLRIISFDKPVNEDWLERYGHVPLPPYIERQDEGTDADRYQTVYADPSGSVAAPTAGLHLTEKLLERIRARAVDIETVTLHVGIGTFLPIRSGTIEEHAMHKESYEVPERTAEAVTAARKAGRPIVAVGTTSVRTLESAWQGRELRAGKGVTALYIVPGYRFRAVDALLTNFHTPGSTLLVLVSAFAGADFVRRAYGEAIRERYRFFSYGDAMFIRSAASGRPP
jgi:S-adenosylmethionine:tRNA ribosyltransferase-isomerase